MKFIKIKKRLLFEEIEMGSLSKKLKFIEDFDVDNLDVLDREIE